MGISLVAKMESFGITRVVEKGVTQKQEGFNNKVGIRHLIYDLYTVGTAVTLALKGDVCKTYKAFGYSEAVHY